MADVWPFPCADYVHTRSFAVPGFFLDDGETTNECYKSCVQAGACGIPLERPDAPAWDSPERADFAVSVERDQAAAFCAFRGGRLPTLAEMTRAMQGDAAAPVPQSLLSTMIACPGKEWPADCQPLSDRLYAPYPSEPVSSDATDVGPFGHRDLLFGQIEPTVTQPPPSPESAGSFCALPPGAIAPATFNPKPSYDYLYLWFAPARFLASGVFGDPSIWRAATYVTITPEHAEPTRMRQGVRCAYDPAKP
jgi:hypothetical protein